MLTNELKALIGIGILTLAILIGGAFFLSGSSSPQTPTGQEEIVDKRLLVKENSTSTGPKNAKVTFVEFGDYQCPACASAHPTVERILEDYKGKINFVFRHFPLPQHDKAKLAAYVAEAAGRQGKYWEMHTLLYENQTEWAESNKPMDIFTQYAEKLELDTETFKEAVKNDEIKKKVDQDRQDGGALSVSSTPTFFINGVELRGAARYDEFQGFIDEVLKSDSEKK